MKEDQGEARYTDCLHTEQKEGRSSMKPGTQIAYIPDHAKSSGLTHPDVEFGFVMREQGNSHFCRYWRKGHPRDLRTIANSELTSNRDLVEVNSVPQGLVDALVEGFKKERHGHENECLL